MKKYNEEQRLMHLEKYHNSGKSGQEYCRENRIKATTFYNWLKTKNNRKKVTKTEDLPFVEVKIPAEKHVFEKKEENIVLESGRVRIHLPLTASVELLKRILKVVIEL